uniref:Uncharacterized protein n=1 Tax=Trichuris muris TaxID=70415 RepID=A0A5S6R1V3_TRIMR
MELPNIRVDLLNAPSDEKEEQGAAGGCMATRKERSFLNVDYGPLQQRRHSDVPPYSSSQYVVHLFCTL